MRGAACGRAPLAGVGLAAALLLAPARAAAQQPLGAEFQVNTYTTGYQSDPDVAIDAAGNFVVAWVGAGPGNARGVFARRFTSGGAPLGPEFAVNAYTTTTPSSPRVAVDAQGRAAFVWSRSGIAPWGIDARVFDAGGNPLGPAFAVNEYTMPWSTHPSVTSVGDGSFVVSWQQYAPSGPFRSTVRGRRFGLDGPDAPEFVVAEVAAVHDYYNRTRVSSDASGRFVVAWDGDTYVDEDTYINFRVNARRYDVPGVVAGPTVTLAAEDSSEPAVGMGTGGRFVVAWARDGSVRYRRFDATSAPLAAELAANQGPAEPFGYMGTALAADAKGGFVVTWLSPFPWDVVGRRFDRHGFPMSSDFVVSTAASDPRSVTAVSMNASGDFVAAWPSWSQDGDRMGIFARRFTLPDVIFVDGFESGDLSRWPTLTPAAADLAVLGGAALSGTAFGLRATVNDTQGVWVQDEAPNDEDRYLGRFYFDPSGIDPGEALGHRRLQLYLALSQEPLKRLVQIVLRRIAGAYALRGRVRLDDDTLVETPFVPITDAPHLVEFDWRRATASGANDGSFALSVDGVPVPALTGLDNDERGVDSARLGAISVKTGATGTLDFDEFLSRRR
jgi:hypothetical protein